jgi:hypothetical protein
MLRASVEMQGGEAKLDAIVDSTAADASGIAHAGLLLAFAEASVGDDEAALAAAREALLGACGPEVLVDTAAVVANFQRMVRIADSTGISLDTPMLAVSGELRDELGINAFGSAANTPELGLAAKAAGRVLQPVVGLGLRIAGRLRVLVR